MAANQAANRHADLLLDGGAAGENGLGTPWSRRPDPLIPNLGELEPVSAGPASSVYRAEQTLPRRPVAVKVLHDELSSDTGQRFDRERTIAGQLSGQSSVVPLLECGVTGDDEPYLVMPWYARGSLARLLGDHGRLGWREAAFLMEPIAVTLAEVHSQGLVHRNLKPENILFTDFLLPRVADFGMSLPAGTRSTAATLVRTPFYSAPEMAVPLEADPRADVYSLGAILWAMLTGQVTFGGDNVVLVARTATAQARTGRPPAANVTVPDSLRDLVGRSMSDDPRERPANAATFVSELRRGVARPNETVGSAVNTAAVMAATAPDEPTVVPSTATNARSNAAALTLAAATTTAPTPTRPPTGSTTATGPTPGSPARSGAGAGGAGTVDGARSGPEASAPSSHHAMAATRQKVATALAPTAQAAKTDARYVLMLVGLITVVILVMVLAALMSVG